MIKIPKINEILFIVDNIDLYNLVTSMFQEETLHKFHVTKAISLDDGIESLNNNYFDAVILNIDSPNENDVIEILNKFNNHFPNIPILLISENSNEKVRLSALEQGAQDYFLKNELNKESLTRSILYAIQRKKKELKLFNHTAKHQINGIEKEFQDKYVKLNKLTAERAEELLRANERLEKKIDKNKISDKKARANEKREQARSEEFARVLDAVPAAVWISHDNKGLLITGNQLSYDYLNIAQGANASKSSSPGNRPDTFKIFKNGVELTAEQMPVQLSSSGIEIRNYEFDLVYSDNTVRHMMGNATPLYDEKGNPTGSVSAFIDVTASKEAEIKMEELLKELERSNRELEQFAYISSHDLKEPLRMISSFTLLLQKRYAGKIDKDADEFIEFIVDGAQRMQQLLDDLLLYSRITSEAEKYERISLDEVVDECLMNLKIAIKESNAKINCEPLPEIVANRTEMIQLFQNLIANSIKFQNSKIPEIQISSKIKNNKYIFSVKDNGIGINPQHQKRIFKMFQRLNTREEYEGTGIGLSITKKIVQQHKGSIWVKSKPGEGSTFYFTLPI